MIGTISGIEVAYEGLELEGDDSLLRGERGGCGGYGGGVRIEVVDVRG
jgi:hypothetical protein